MKLDIETKIAQHHSRIFLIDPDVIHRSGLFFMLSVGNDVYEMDKVSDVAEMDARLKPDMVIVDAMVVAEHGRRLIQGWRIAWPEARILIICEACDLECLAAARDAGADDALQRPFRADEVRRVVERLLDGKRETRGHAFWRSDSPGLPA